MKRRVMLALACLAMLGFAIQAEEPDAPQKAPELTTVEVINGATFAPQKNIDTETKLMAVALRLPQATFQRDGGVLRVGTHIAGVDQGRVLQVELQSDCPNNSQFHIEAPPLFTQKYDGMVREAVFAWTKLRHDDFSAKLQQIVVSDLADTSRKNYDVRLDLSRVSSVSRR